MFLPAFFFAKKSLEYLYMSQDKQFPEGMVPLGEEAFQFACHSGVQCFTVCCRNVDMILYPYDIIRLKNHLKIDSEEFLQRFTLLVAGDNIYFPTVKLKLNSDVEKSCPFLDRQGCRVYQDRPTACRTYPLERAVDRNRQKGAPEEFYFMSNHSYCLGHQEDYRFTVKSWLRNQRLFEHNLMNDLWSEIDTLFASNPWKGEGVAGEKQKMAFLVCYNVDGFRRFAAQVNLVDQFQLAKDIRRRLAVDDSEMLKFGFEWLKLLFGRSSSLLKK